MSSADAFLRAIVADPADDAPRLIFADWLDERGDPRGQFIRVQCALERLPPHNPARFDLAEEECTLLEKHEAEWAAPLRGLAAEWRFRRGFVEDVTLSAEAFASPRGAALFAAFPLRVVRLRLDRRLRDLREAAFLGTWRHLARVELLDFSDCGLRDGDVRDLLASPHLTRLTGLVLSHNELEGPAVQDLAESGVLARLTMLGLNKNRGLGVRATRALAQSPASAALRVLQLSHTNVGLNGLRDLLVSPHLTSLTTLHSAAIGYYGVAGTPAASLAGAPVLARLTDLDLGGFAGSGGMSELLTSPVLGRLTRLRLSECAVREGGARALAASPHLAGLATLELERCGIGAEGAKALAGSPHLAGLTTLRLGENAVRDSGAKALAASDSLTRLTVLDLRKNQIGGPGLRALADSPNLVGLTELDLSENFFNFDSLRALAASPHLGRLASLSLNSNRLEDGGAMLLAASPHLGRLTELHLGANRIGDAGLRALLHSPHLVRLRELNVRVNPVGAAGADALAALLDAAPRFARLRKLDLQNTRLSGPEQRQLQQRYGSRVEL
jgi:uncharacterized protein (TIGR02996 family)